MEHKGKNTRKPGNVGSGSVGNRAISTVSFDTWSSESVSAPSQRKRQTKDQERNIFRSCAEVIQDKFWTKSFAEFSNGKFPEGFSFIRGELQYKDPEGVEDSVRIPDDPIKASAISILFFQKHGIASETKMYTPTPPPPAQKPLLWAEASEKMRECMINAYSIDMKYIMGLSIKETTQLSAIINAGITNKHFGKNNIITANNKIYSISGLRWNPDERTFSICESLAPARSKPSQKKDEESEGTPSGKDPIPQFEARWKKYLDILDKKITKNSRDKSAPVAPGNYPCESSCESLYFDSSATASAQTDDEISIGSP